MEQADGNARHAEVDEVFDRFDHARLVERLDHLAVESQAFRDLGHEVERDEARRLDPEERVAVAVGHRLAGNLDDVPETGSHEKPESLETVLEHGIGRRGRAVEHLDRRRGGASRDLPDPLEKSPAWVVGRARGLHGDLFARRLVDGDDVGERSPGIDGDAQAHRLSGC